MQAICGTDYALYLIFLRSSAYLLLVITVFNAVVIVPLYVTGDPMPSDDWKANDLSKMNVATVLNVTGTQPKMIFAYICAIVIIPTMAFYMIFVFR